MESVDTLKVFMVSSLEQIPEIGPIKACRSGEEALEVTREGPIDILITALNLPGMTGIDLIGQLKESHPGIKTIACTKDEDIKVIDAVFQAGAVGYLLKDCDTVTLRNSIRQAMNGEYCVSPQIVHQLVTNLLKKDIKKDITKDLNPLSYREKEILASLASGYRYKEIADQLNLSYNTVHSHIKNIYKKLNKKGRMSAISHAKKLGLIENQDNSNAVLANKDT